MVTRTTTDTGFKYYPQIVVDGHRFQPSPGITTAAFPGTKVKVRVVRGEDRRRKPRCCWISYTDAGGSVHSEVWNRI